MNRVLSFLKYVIIFARELVIANFQVVKLVLSPTMKIRPGFLTVPIKAKSDMEVTSLANSITLTPGTISVHIPHDRHAIVIHALNIGDEPNDVRTGIQDSLEANILKWTRADGGVGAKLNPRHDSTAADDRLSHEDTRIDDAAANPHEDENGGNS